MQKIDLSNWDRAQHYHFFKRMDYPHYLICANIDITNFIKLTKKRGLPFYYSMVFAATHAINQIPEFKYRVRGDDVVLHDIIHPAYSDMAEGSDLFKMVTLDFKGNIEDFISSAAKKSKNQTEYFPINDLSGRDDLTYITCIPWISFTNISHTMNFGTDDSVPRLAWGKYFSENGKTLIPFSVQAHHSFVDGLHMGRYYEALQTYLDEFR